MGALIGSLIFFFIAYLLMKSIEKDNKKLKDNGINRRMFFKYCGGDEEVISDCDVRLDWKDEYLEINFQKTLSLIKQDLVKYNDIVSFRGMTEQQIRSDVTLTRLALFGAFAFGMKKQKVNNQYFIVIKYLKNGLEKELILGEGVSGIQGALTDSIRMLNEFKTKHNNIESSNL